MPVAASRIPNNGRMSVFVLKMKICCSSHEFVWIVNQAIDRIRPISPMRLYKMACRAAVLASVRPNHQPISKNDMIPTPSHPMNS